ncbi:MAG: hypothetical protein JW881_04540 [Spirochaetales bacterium]|nr:hypothetical protein [Spirochaetales bacterium]
MEKKLLILTQNKNRTASLSRYLAGKGYGVTVIEREKILHDGRLAVSEDTVRYGDTDILSGTLAAFIPDLGYMWPQPALEPTEAEWLACRKNLDEYLRNERESASLWFSLLEIVNDAVPLCVNPQRAYEAAVFKPWAFELLTEAGVPVAPSLAGNDPERIASFLKAHDGCFLSLPLAGIGAAEWMDENEIRKHPLNETPLFLQALTGTKEIQLVAAGGKQVCLEPSPLEVPEKLPEKITVLQKTLAMPLAGITLREGEGGMVIGDFEPSPDLEALPEDIRGKVFAALCCLLKDKDR